MVKWAFYVRLLFALGGIIVLFSCKESVPKEKEIPNEIQKESSAVTIPPVENDTILLTLRLQNKIQTVYALEKGRVLTSELATFTAQKLDSTSLLLSLDNKEAFLKLRKLKLELIEEIERTNNLELKEELQRFREAIILDNIMPELVSERFSSDFIKWVQKHKMYTLYKEAILIESTMSNYFYLNERPVFLLKIYYNVGSDVKKGQKLYDYLNQEPLLYVVDKVGFNKEDIIEVYDLNKNKIIEKFDYNNGMMRIEERFIANQFQETKQIRVVLTNKSSV